jgi:hypothetical protein
MFRDDELRALARHLPRTIGELEPLLSANKIERYGREVVGVIENATR